MAGHQLDLAAIICRFCSLAYSQRVIWFCFVLFVGVAEGQAGKKKKRVLKRIIRTKKPDGTYTTKEVIISDPKEVEELYLHWVVPRCVSIFTSNEFLCSFGKLLQLCLPRFSVVCFATCRWPSILQRKVHWKGPTKRAVLRKMVQIRELQSLFWLAKRWRRVERL